MVRTVHTNHFYEILAQISDPKIEFLTKTHFLKNDHVQNFWKLTFWPAKSPCGVVPQQNKGCKHIPEYSRPNLYIYIYIYMECIENRQFSIKFAIWWGGGSMAGGLKCSVSWWQSKLCSSLTCYAAFQAQTSLGLCSLRFPDTWKYQEPPQRG